MDDIKQHIIKKLDETLDFIVNEDEWRLKEITDNDRIKFTELGRIKVESEDDANSFVIVSKDELEAEDYDDLFVIDGVGKDWFVGYKR